MPVTSLKQLQDAVDRYGADIDRWPPAVRQEAAALLGNSAEARALIEAALKRETELRAPSAIKAPAGLADRIVAAALDTRPGKTRG